MKNYIKNICLYIVALLGLVSFLSIFGSSLQIKDEVRNVWVNYKVNAYVGESLNEVVTYKGAVLPIFGFVFPLIIAIVLIAETFKPQWADKLNTVNTVLAIILSICAILVLLTKERFLFINDLGKTSLLRNGSGPILSAVCSFVGSAILLVVSWIPSPNKIEFIEN